MRMTATLQLPQLDLNGYVRRLGDEITEALTQAAFEWVEAATAEIPVWSGASHATFLHLAREIGFSLSIGEAPNAPRRVNLGLRTSEGSFDADPKTGQFSFTYETRLKHLVYNEYNNANISPDPGLFSQLITPGPYDFQGRSREAFLRSVRNVQLPDARDFVKVKIRQVR